MQYTMFLTTIIEICKYKMMYNTIIVYTLMIVYLILGEILMESNQRTKNTVFNIYASLIYQIVSGLLNFVVRKVFLIYFSVDYLGLDGLFSNVINMLTLLDFGIGPSCVYFIIKSLANEDEDDFSTSYKLYSYLYKAVGFIIAIAGVFICFHLDWFIEAESMQKYNTSFIQIVFILTFLRSLTFYFFSCPRTTMLYAQKNYLNMITNTCVTIVFAFIKIGSLIITHNYYIYLTVLLFEILFYYLFGYIIFKNLYPNIKTDSKKLKAKLPDVLGYSRKILISNVSLFLFNSTDNIIISKFLGLSIVGLMSNYYMIVNLIGTFANQIFEAATGSVTNFVNDKKANSIDKMNELMSTLNFIAFIVANFCATCLFALTDGFIGVFYGWNLVLGKEVILALVINIIIVVFQNPLSAYSNGRGLINYEVKYTILMSVVNIVLSILLSNRIGVLGVLIGTIVANLILLYGRYNVVFNNLNLDKKNYVKKIVVYFAVILFNFLIINLVFSNNGNFINLIIRGLFSVFIITIETLCFRNYEEYQSTLNFVKSFLHLNRR